MSAFLPLSPSHSLHLRLRRPTSVVRHFIGPFRCAPLPVTNAPLSPVRIQPFQHTVVTSHAHSTRAQPRRSTVQPRTNTEVSSLLSPTLKPTSTHPAVRAHMAQGLGVVTLRSNKARLFVERRATTVYSGAIQVVIGTVEQNSPVVVLDSSFNVVGYGLYNPASLFRVRLLRISPLTEDASDDGDETCPQWVPSQDLSRLLTQAVQMRRMFNLPNVHTDVYRVVNADGDGLPGLFVDRFASVAVISSCAAWCEALREDIKTAVRDSLSVDGVTHVIWRPHKDRLKQDGYELPAKPIQVRNDNDAQQNDQQNTDTDNPTHTPTTTGERAADLTDADIDALVRKDAIVGLEQGVRYSVPLWVLSSGQKTGHYADHRDTRRYVANLVTNSSPKSGPLRMLDLFCYSGGFSLAALRARSDLTVTAVDSSRNALSLLRHNAELNDVSSRLTTVRADAARGVFDPSQGYDIVIVDPPKLAPNVKALVRALGKYKRINETALRNVSEEGGIVISCSCSAAIAQNRTVLVDAVREAAGNAKRSVTLVKTFGASPDHAVHAGMMETEYLTVCVFAVM